MDAAAARRGLAQFFVDPKFRGVPVLSLFTALPHVSPVMQIEDQWVVSDHRLIKRLAANDRLEMGQADFPDSARAANPGFVDFFSNNLFFKPMDEHARLRGILSAHFVPATISDLEEPTRRLATQLTLEAAREDTFDAVAAVASRLPALVAAMVIGVPDEDRVWMATQADGLLTELCQAFPSTGGSDGTPIGAHQFSRLRAYFDDLLTVSPPAPGTLAHRLSTAVVHDGVSLDDAVDLLILLLMAGVDTVITGIANAMWVMLEHPAALTRVAEGGLPAQQAFAEAIRLFAPVPFAHRRARARVEIDDVTVHPGQDVLLCLAAGNRDPRVFDDPGAFRPGRGRSLSFGHGLYHCIGAALGAVEGAAVLSALATLDRTRGVHRTAEPDWNPNVGFHSPASLAVSVGGAHRRRLRA